MRCMAPPLLQARPPYRASPFLRTICLNHMHAYPSLKALLLLRVQEFSVASEVLRMCTAPPCCKPDHLTVPAPSWAQSASSICMITRSTMLSLRTQEFSVAEEDSVRSMAPPSCNHHLNMPAPSCAQSASSTCMLTCPALFVLSEQEDSVAEVAYPRYMAPPSCRPHDSPLYSSTGCTSQAESDLCGLQLVQQAKFQSQICFINVQSSA